MTRKRGKKLELSREIKEREASRKKGKKTDATPKKRGTNLIDVEFPFSGKRGTRRGGLAKITSRKRNIGPTKREASVLGASHGKHQPRRRTGGKAKKAVGKLLTRLRRKTNRWGKKMEDVHQITRKKMRGRGLGKATTTTRSRIIKDRRKKKKRLRTRGKVATENGSMGRRGGVRKGGELGWKRKDQRARKNKLLGRHGGTTLCNSNVQNYGRGSSSNEEKGAFGAF